MRLFLPCAAGVEALLCDEIGRLLPGSAARAQRGVETQRRQAFVERLGAQARQQGRRRRDVE